MTENKNKGWQRVLALIIPYIFIVGFFQFIGLIIAEVDFINKEQPKDTNQHLIVTFFNLLGTFLTIWIFTKYVDKDKFINLGFHLKNKFKSILIGLFVGAVIMISGYVLLIYLNEIVYLKSNFDIQEIAMTILLFLFVAIIEETLLRGYVLKNLMLSFNKYIALIFSSFLFALIHSANPNMSLLSFSNLFLAGVFLGISYIHTKNLWFPIALHFSWNLSQTFLGFNVSGQDIYSILEFKIQEKNILNGGDFGFEGSILSIIFQILFIILIAFFYIKKNKII